MPNLSTIPIVVPTIPLSPPAVNLSSPHTQYSPQISPQSLHESSSSASSLPYDPYDFSNSTSPIQAIDSVSHPTDSVSAGSSTPTLNRRGVNPPIRYGDWYYAFSAIAGTLPPVPKTIKRLLKVLLLPNGKLPWTRNSTVLLQIRHGGSRLFLRVGK